MSAVNGRSEGNEGAAEDVVEDAAAAVGEMQVVHETAESVAIHHLRMARPLMRVRTPQNLELATRALAPRSKIPRVTETVGIAHHHW